MASNLRYRPVIGSSSVSPPPRGTKATAPIVPTPGTNATQINSACAPNVVDNKCCSLVSGFTKNKEHVVCEMDYS